MASISAKDEDGYLVGCYRPITYINDLDLIKATKFVVTEYNKQSGAKLKFKKLTECESQVVAGMNYNLTLSATEGSVLKIYETVVWERLWLYIQNLTSFAPLHA